MAKPSVAEVYNLSRALLDDNLVAGGEVHTNEVLAPFFGVAYRQLADVFADLRIGVMKRITYFKVDPLQWRIELGDKGINLAAEPQQLREALIAAEYSLTGVSNTLPLTFTTTVTPSAILPNDAIYTYGIGGQIAANGRWYVSSVVGNNVAVGGGDTSGTYTSGGALVKITGKMQDSYPVSRLDEQDEAVAISNRQYRFRESAIETSPVPHAGGRLFELTYYESPIAPTSGEIPVNGSLNFLGTQTAALAVESLGNREVADRLAQRAIGHMRELLANYGIRDYVVQLPDEAQTRRRR